MKTIVNTCNNIDVISDFVNKMKINDYHNFTDTQKEMYQIMLEIIKEINYDTFVEIKRKVFFFENTSGETERSTFRVRFYQNI